MSTVVLLGPQRLAPTVGEEVTRLGLRGPIATITAGWQEREPEDDEMRAALGIPAQSLRLYARWEEIQGKDPTFFDAHRARQDRLRRLQELYRLRLDCLMQAADRMWEADGAPDLLEPERKQAIDAIRALDEHHLRRSEEEADQFEEAVQPFRRPEIARHRDEIAQTLLRCDSVAIAGGHVGVLLNRLKMFGLLPFLRERPVLAWSAGAMALTDRVVLFHDRPPQGAGHAELLDRGLGLFPGIVVLPHARKRLEIHPRKVSLWARRFAPAACVPMDERRRLQIRNGRVEPGPGILRMDGSGVLRPLQGRH